MKKIFIVLGLLFFMYTTSIYGENVRVTKIHTKRYKRTYRIELLRYDIQRGSYGLIYYVLVLRNKFRILSIERLK